MRIVRGLRNLNERLPSPTVALGNFDGVHVGHQAIFARTVDQARREGGTAMVYTFDPHPLKILAPDQEISLLTGFKKKMELVAGSGIEVALLADFNRNFARMHPKEFATRLKEGIGMTRVVVGHDYSFGQGKSGTIESLSRLGEELGFTVEVVEAVEREGGRVSSTRIRGLLFDGEVATAARLLGRPYSLEGKVVEGYKRGRTLGFPTANLETPFEVVPATGVYAVRVSVEGGAPAPGVANVGFNPTFGRDDFIIETYLIDYNGDLYGKELEIFFVARLRGETRFASVEELKAQIGADIDAARRALV
ncbi:MAG: bifunctional riboflavin kinase/FAD synthetase [Nitrospinae bacterium]|nr:bifunctional riboflavin kinase/FAD synthetase [Nitrospinota bacterium]